jgi:hypothetical protein
MGLTFGLQGQQLIFNKETGIVLSDREDIVHVTTGSAGSVEFPSEIIWQIHQRTPGYIYCLMHSHPDHMVELSHEDITTLKGWAYAMYPYPIRMGTFCKWENELFVETIYLASLESRGEWIARGKEGARKFEIITESTKPFVFNNGDVLHPPWYSVIINKSYMQRSTVVS